MKLHEFTFVRRPWKIETTHQGVATHSLGTMALRIWYSYRLPFNQSCWQASFWISNPTHASNQNPAWARRLVLMPDSSLKVRLSQDMRNCGALVAKQS